MVVLIYIKLSLSNFNTSNVTDMWHMFYGCYRLSSLDLSSFNTSNVDNISFMFAGCYNLYYFVVLICIV